MLYRFDVDTVAFSVVILLSIISAIFTVKCEKVTTVIDDKTIIGRGRYVQYVLPYRVSDVDKLMGDEMYATEFIT